MQITAVNKDVEVGEIKGWLQNSYKIYKAAKAQFTLFAIITTVIGAIPIVGSFMMPIFTAKYAEMASKVEREEEISFAEFFIGLFSRKTIVLLGAIHIIVYIIAIGIKFLLFKDNIPVVTMTEGIIKLTSILIAIIIAFMFILTFWLSPIICLKNEDMKALPALILGFKAFFRNIGKMLLYIFSVVFLAVIVIAILIAMVMYAQHHGYLSFSFIPGILGIVFLLIWIPILRISTYFMYKSLFLTYNE